MILCINHELRFSDNFWFVSSFGLQSQQDECENVGPTVLVILMVYQAIPKTHRTLVSMQALFCWSFTSWLTYT